MRGDHCRTSARLVLYKSAGNCCPGFLDEAEALDSSFEEQSAVRGLQSLGIHDLGHVTWTEAFCSAQDSKGPRDVPCNQSLQARPGGGCCPESNCKQIQPAENRTRGDRDLPSQRKGSGGSSLSVMPGPVRNSQPSTVRMSRMADAAKDPARGPN